MEKVYVEFEGMRYLINHPDHGMVIRGRQLALIALGEYGELPKAIYEAQAAHGIPHRFAWRGIENSLGDFGWVSPPTKGRPVEA